MFFGCRIFYFFIFSGIVLNPTGVWMQIFPISQSGFCCIDFALLRCSLVVVKHAFRSPPNSQNRISLIKAGGKNRPYVLLSTLNWVYFISWPQRGWWMPFAVVITHTWTVRRKRNVRVELLVSITDQHVVVGTVSLHRVGWRSCVWFQVLQPGWTSAVGLLFLFSPQLSTSIIIPPHCSSPAFM